MIKDNTDYEMIDKLKFKIKESGRTIATLARELNTPYNTISKKLNGLSPMSRSDVINVCNTIGAEIPHSKPIEPKKSSPSSFEKQLFGYLEYIKQATKANTEKLTNLSKSVDNIQKDLGIAYSNIAQLIAQAQNQEGQP